MKGKEKEKEKECEESNKDDGIEVQSGDDTHLVDVMPVSPSPVVPPHLFGNAVAVSVALRSVGLQSRSVSWGHTSS